MVKGIRVWAAVENGLPIYHLLGSMRETVERELDLCLPHWRDQVSAQTDMQWAERLAKDGLGPTAWERACAWARGEVDAYPERAR